MNPMKITIYGNYFDCQIYRGRLYLWTFDGELLVYNWNSIVNTFINQEIDRIAMTFCFLDGNYLYKSSLVELFHDEEFRKLLLNKFARIQKTKYQITGEELKNHIISKQDIPSKILPTDTEIYGNTLYFATDKGFYSCDVHMRSDYKSAINKNVNTIWDCNLLSIKANKYPQIALSAGSEGLYEYNFIADNKPCNLKKIDTFSDIYQISTKHSMTANYTYQSIYNTSNVSNSYLAEFQFIKREKWSRDFKEIIFDNNLFKCNGNRKYLSWGIADKIYRAKEHGFEIIKYFPSAKHKKGQETFERIDDVNIDAWKGEVVNGGTAYFGNIVECKNALVIIMSDKKIITIPGPITRWRVFPRSLNYENHLHVILDNKIVIYSFNQDYFIDQNNKAIGIKYSEEKHNRGKRTSYFNDFSFKKYAEDNVFSEQVSF